jgi:hypothetical protein
VNNENEITKICLYKKVNVIMNGSYVLGIEFTPSDIVFMTWAIFRSRALYAFASALGRFEIKPPLV